MVCITAVGLVAAQEPFSGFSLAGLPRCSSPEVLTIVRKLSSEGFKSGNPLFALLKMEVLADLQNVRESPESLPTKRFCATDIKFIVDSTELANMRSDPAVQKLSGLAPVLNSSTPRVPINYSIQHTEDGRLYVNLEE